VLVSIIFKDFVNIFESLIRNNSNAFFNVACFYSGFLFAHFQDLTLYCTSLHFSHCITLVYDRERTQQLLERCNSALVSPESTS